MFLDALYTRGIHCPIQKNQMNVRYETIKTPCYVSGNGTPTNGDNNKYISNNPRIQEASSAALTNHGVGR